MWGRLYDAVLRPAETFGLSHLRHELLAFAKGRTLEIGVGTGLNLSHYPPVTELIGIDPDPHMLTRARERASASERVSLEEGDAQNLPFGDEEFDTVVATLVFCTVPDPQKAMNEVWRVLKPGGRFLLLEHVRRNTPIAGEALDLLTPLWKPIAGGCHLNRDPERYLEGLRFRRANERTLWRGFGKLYVLEKPSVEAAADGRPRGN